MNKIVCRRNKKKHLTLALIVIVALLVVLCFLYHQVNPTDCYSKPIWTDGKTLEAYSKNPNIKNSQINKIFFHETSCVADGIIKLNARQACAIESAGDFIK
jgi:lactosylceramide 4-alpha-galactosyltransferase